MIYRNFNISIVPAIVLERYNYATQTTDLCDGFYCEVYRVDDDGLTERLDDFTLAEGYEIADTTLDNCHQAIFHYVDEHFWRLDSVRNEVAEERKNTLLGRLIGWIGEDQQGAELYDTLSNYIRMTDDEIRQSGYLSLVEYFDRDCYAQTIAEFIIAFGTENTLSGNRYVPFSLIARRYGVDLAADEEMLDKVCDCLYRHNEVVAEFEIENQEFNMLFFTDYCPMAREDEEPGMTQQM